VIIVGSSKAVHTAFENNRTNLRRSGLKDRLAADLDQ
jgi:exodeoxyribonuclease V alpha subunit